MNKKTIKKVFTFILTMLTVIFCSYNIVYGDGGSSEPAYKKFTGTVNPAGQDTVKAVINIVLANLRIFAAGVAVIVITYLGAKYMMSAASEKAQIKSNIINFVIGVIVVEGAITIVEIIQGFARSVNNDFGTIIGG